MKYLSDIKGMRNAHTAMTRKLFNMPRTNGCRKEYLELYILDKEKSRMEQELEMLEVKRGLVIKNVSLIDSKMAEYRDIVNNSTQGKCEDCTLPAADLVSVYQSEMNSQNETNLQSKESTLKFFLKEQFLAEEKGRTDCEGPILRIQFDKRT